MSPQPDQSPPVLLYFQEIRPGDVKKYQERSNENPQSGGGARDLRVPLDYQSVLAQMFPRPGSDSDVHKGVIHWDGPEEAGSAEIELWPPTDARPTELRIARIHDIHGWKVDEVAYKHAQASGQKWFYALEQSSDGKVRARILKEDALDQERPELRQYLRERVLSTPPTRSVRGTIDFQRRSYYP